MNSVICDAIDTKQVIQFNYKGGLRIVEPYCHGVSTAGNDVLRGYQTSGYSESGKPAEWKLFRVSEMAGLVVTNETFSGNRSGYNPHDAAMTTVYCHV